MKIYKITYEDGDVVFSGFNGDYTAAREYWLGSVFNIGWPHDKLLKVVKVEEVDQC